MSCSETAEFLRAHPGCIRIDIAEAKGSTPRERGAWMLVGPDGTLNTIGGGRLEFMAIERARAMLRDAVGAERMEVPLGPEIGQCCGGRIALELRRVDEALAAETLAAAEAAERARPHVYLFGAGHVGTALARALALMPLRVILADTRAEELAKAPPGAETRHVALPETLVRDAPPGSAFVILTHDHALDFLIASAALARGDAAYVGMIGSKTKRATFRSWYRKEGGSDADAERLICPIGSAESRDKRPAVIAALAAAEIVAALEGFTRRESGQ